jgi:predicted RNase H-like HicB family nuclease
MAKTKYAYPAQFINEDNGTVSVYFPDLDGCYTYDDTIEGAAIMAQEALELYIDVALEEGLHLSCPSLLKDLKEKEGIVMMVIADPKNMKRQNKAVNKTVTLPYWLNIAAEKEHINFSGVLQEALKEKLSTAPISDHN